MEEYEIYQKVRRYIREKQMLNQKDRVVIGVSGGADSMALTDLLCRVREEWELDLFVVHVNHGIRGEEAFRDQKAVEAFCGERELPYRIFAFDVPKMAKNAHLGIEEAGRMCREQAFREVLLEAPEKNTHIALAHNENDLAETMLHHLARGTGLRGLCGILPVSGDRIRPVLCLNRKEIEWYCAERGLPYVTDSTNLEDHYTRNRIRHQILPIMEEQVNREVIHHFSETAARIAEAEVYLQEQAKKLLERQARTEFGFLLNPSFFQEPEILKSYAIFQAMEQIGGKRKDLASIHVREILDLWGQDISKKVMLPYGIMAGRTYQGIWIEKKVKKDHLAAEEIYLLPKDGILNCQWGSFETKIFPYNGEKIEEKKYTKWFDYDIIKTSLVVRTRRKGDFLTVNQEGQKKKLNRYFIDTKVPSENRDYLPLVAEESEILWVPGGRINEKYKIKENTRNVFQVEYKRGEF